MGDIVRISGESLGEMAWKVYKEEVIRLIMVRTGASLEKQRDKLDNARDLGDDVNSHIEKVSEKLDFCYSLFSNSVKVAEKKLSDFDSELQARITDTLVHETKKVVRGGY